MPAKKGLTSRRSFLKGSAASTLGTTTMLGVSRTEGSLPNSGPQAKTNVTPKEAGLRAVVISDLHLGDPLSILCDRRWQKSRGLVSALLSRRWQKSREEEIDSAIDSIANAISEIASQDGAAPIEQFILLGDIPDLTLDGSPDSQVSKGNTSRLVSAISEKTQINELVLVPGNHDYGLWVQMRKKMQQKNPNFPMTNYEFEKVGTTSWGPKHYDIAGEIKDSVLRNSYLYGAKVPAIKIAYPIYSISNDTHFFLFHHGHLHSTLVMHKHILREIMDGKIQTVKQLEERVSDIIWGLWGSRPESMIGRYLRMGKEALYKKIFLPSHHIAVGLSAYDPGHAGALYRGDEIGVAEKELQNNIKAFIQLACKIPLNSGNPNLFDPDYKFQYVFGHTHIGGRIRAKENTLIITNDNDQEKSIDVWNLGGWQVPEGLFPPYAGIFYIKNDWTADRCLFISDKFEAPSLKFYSSKLLGEHARYRTEIG